MIRSWIVLVIAGATHSLAAQSHPDAKALVNASIDAMGGQGRLAGLTSYRMDGMQYEYILGNAERSEGPWRTQYSKLSEVWDVANHRLRRTATNVLLPAGSVGSEIVSIVTDSVMAMMAGPRIIPGYGGFYEDYRDRMTGSPSQVLLDAARAPSLHWERVVQRLGVMYDVVSFTTPNGPVRVELARNSHLPDAVEIVRHPRLEARRTMFGDVTVRIEYEDWNSQLSGLWWPMQHRFFFNGEIFRDISLTRLDTQAAVTPDSFYVADSTRAQYNKAAHTTFAYIKLGDRPEPPQPGGDIVRLADNWAMTLVKQDDGVVVFEAHLSDQYIQQVVGEVHRRWPGAPIKAFVLTSDPWAHLGGVRQVVALGIPIYVNGGSIPFLKALAARPFTLEPDALAKAPKPPRFIAVDAKTTIGTGKNRIELYPVGGAYSERMTMAYFPERKLLYGADLVFPDRPAAGAPTGTPAPKTFSRTPAVELIAAVRRQGLQVDSLFCVQASYPIFAWADFKPTGTP